MRIKKGDIKNKPLNELIDADLSLINGVDKFDDASEVNVGSQKTDDFAQQTRQHSLFFNAMAYGTAGSSLRRVNSYDDVDFNTIDPNYKDDYTIEGYEDEELEESVGKTVNKIIKELLTKKNNGGEFVDRITEPDVNRNNIPDIEELKDPPYDNPIASSAAMQFIKALKTVTLKPDDKAIVVNFVLSNIDMSDVDRGYKNIIKKNLK